MKIKKYRATTMPEIMNQVRKELGKEAVILQSREVFDGGFLGMFQKKRLEVIAALDDEPLQQQVHRKKGVSSNEPDVMTEIKWLRRMVEEQTNQSKPFIESEYLQIYQYLLSQEFDAEMSKAMVKRVRKKHQESGLQPDLTEIKMDMMKELQTRFAACIEMGIHHGHHKRVIQFIGPTGVGKTTTLAKIAALEIKKHQKKVAFITTDTYRIAAVEQLRTYAKILDVPLEVAYSAEDYQKAVQKFSAYDLIFVDTAGRNFFDPIYMKELVQSIDLTEETKNYLVMSLTAKQHDLLLLLRQFEDVHMDGLILTKLDETRQYGSLFTLPDKSGMKIAYLSNGQAVPDDLMEPNPQTISRHIMGDFHAE